MTKATPIDQAYGLMQASSDDSRARMAFYQRLAESELFLLLENEPAGDTISPRLFPVQDAEIALVFDRDDRLAEFAKTVVPYVALSGRAVVSLLTQRNIGLGLNLDVAPSSIVLGADAVDWMAQMLGAKPTAAHARPVAFFAPDDLPETLLSALGAKLGQVRGIARAAYLVRVRYEDDTTGHLLAFIGAPNASEQALSQAISEAIAFGDYNATSLDVAFFAQDDPIREKLAKNARVFDLTAPEAPAAVSAPNAPGMDPQNPPRL